MKLLDHLGNVYPIPVEKFPGGEVKVTLPERFLKRFGEAGMEHICGIQTLIRSSDDLMALVMLVDAIQEEFVYPNIMLDLPYIPYARQDRVCNKGESLSIRAFAKIINSLGFQGVQVADPHSDVAPALINNCVVVSQDKLFMEYYYRNIDHRTDWGIISPDAGANKKVGKICKRLGKDSFIQADKERNLKTGEIIRTVVHQQSVPKNVLIVDDICDGGRTFIELAKVLREKGAENIGLYVTHGIFSKGKEVLLEHIDEVHAYFDWTNENI